MEKPIQPSQLAADLARAEAIKHHMTELLRRLEARAAGHAVDLPGGWRHHPEAWAEQNLPKDPT